MSSVVTRPNIVFPTLAWLLITGVALAEVPAPVAAVNQVRISHSDLAYRLKVEEAYGNRAATEEAVSVALVNEAIEREIGRRAGVSATAQEITSLASFVNGATKAPELLRQIKEIFGLDGESYERLFIEPKVIGWKLRRYFSTTPALHQQERGRIEQVLAGVNGGKSLELAALAAGLSIVSSEVANGAIEPPDVLNPYRGQDAAPSIDPLIGLVRTLAVGETCPNIVEDDFGYRIIRLTARGDKSFQIETVIVAKRAFASWLVEERAKLNIAVVDPEFAAKIKARYPNLGW